MKAFTRRACIAALAFLPFALYAQPVETVKTWSVDGTSLAQHLESGVIEERLGLSPGTVSWSEGENDTVVATLSPMDGVPFQVIWHVDAGGTVSPHNAFARMLHDPESVTEYMTHLHAKLTRPLGDGTRLGPAGLALVLTRPNAEILGWIDLPDTHELHLIWREQDTLKTLGLSYTRETGTDALKDVAALVSCRRSSFRVAWHLTS